MSIRTKLALGLIAILALNLLASLHGFHRLTQAASREAEILETSSDILTLALTAQVHFKKQVQEWKNILLRGGDAELRARYIEQFEQEERTTRVYLERLLTLSQSNPEASAEAEQFLAAHERLGREYRAALAIYQPVAAAPQLEVDRQVRGIDREPTDLLDRVVESALEHRRTTLAQLQLAARRHQLWTLILTGALMSGAALLLMWLVDRNIGRPMATATAVARQMDRANAELARAAQAKDEFLAAMSHELRTPLTSILGLSETMGDGLLGPLSAQQEKAVRMIHENGTHLLELINDILDMSRVASGQMHLRWDQVPVDQLCEASLRLIGPAAKRKGLRVSLAIDPQARLVRGDSRRLKQMLVNLLGNAVKFTPEGGAIGLDVQTDAERGELSFGIWDTGVGIPREQFERLFQPFVQLDSRPARQYDGTGLGLALVSGMAELHQGRIQVESEVGRGSRFEIRLPWDPAAQRADRLQPDPTESNGPGIETGVREPWRVLLVDDNPGNLDMFATYLRIRGCDVRTAGSGAEAIALSRMPRPDVILMDVQMPGMDGLETTRRLRSDPALRAVPIIALTALAMPGDREQCLEAGMDDYLTKPLGLKELHATVAQWVARTRLAASRALS
ncbi:hybrid sensor histidine kinase/response regulator [Allochromatium vinosum]|uniref:hybrid sensor histidine kinase/response regulator n=1 Tax=Allochromatium vinosum TaxID=1049 RepID=UPI001908A08A|nr:response regulator [Allochromatium vinosum]MBK1654425.1 hybrid sensor histidine kinase/response regulator [Allochromatium vinosum]